MNGLCVKVVLQDEQSTADTIAAVNTAAETTDCDSEANDCDSVAYDIEAAEAESNMDNVQVSNA